MPDARGTFENVQRHAEKTTAAALRFMRGSAEGPFFLWVHYYDPHGDYSPGPPYNSMFEGDAGPELPPDRIPAYQRLGDERDASVFVARYDGEIRRTDTQIGKLLDGLRDLGRLDRALVVLTADHGESLTEHGYYFDHGKELYNRHSRSR